MSLALHGTGISKGIAIGKVHRIYSGATDINEKRIHAEQIGHECDRYLAALSSTSAELIAIKSNLPAGTPHEIGAFLDTHTAILNDSSLNDAVIGNIKDKLHSAEWALCQQRDQLLAAFSDIDDAYLRARSEDIKQVTERLLRALTNSQQGVSATTAAKNTIVIADDLSPADLILLHRQGIAGFACEHGSPLSHTAILARNFALPAIIGVHNLKLLKEQELVVLDADSASLLAQPDEHSIDHYRSKLAASETRRLSLQQLLTLPTESADGERATLAANIEIPSEAQHCANSGAEAIGLFRTEFLYMNRSEPPSEEEQFEAYSHVLNAMQGKPVTVRTLDLGADKQVAANPQPDTAVTSNPALGLRGIRLCLAQPTLFKTQLRALVRAAELGPLRIMLPMICNAAEIRQSREIIAEVQQELGLADSVNAPPIGIMIEVPSAALCANELAPLADFFSIGTNDLIQYTLAIDRVDENVNYLYNPLSPAVLKLIKMTIDAAKANNIPVAMCGEMAGDPEFIGLLLGLGLREFSANASGILETKELIRKTYAKPWESIAPQVVNAADKETAQQLLQQALQSADKNSI